MFIICHAKMPNIYWFKLLKRGLDAVQVIYDRKLNIFVFGFGLFLLNKTSNLNTSASAV